MDSTNLIFFLLSKTKKKLILAGEALPYCSAECSYMEGEAVETVVRKSSIQITYEFHNGRYWCSDVILRWSRWRIWLRTRVFPVLLGYCHLFVLFIHLKNGWRKFCGVYCECLLKVYSRPNLKFRSKIPTRVCLKKIFGHQICLVQIARLFVLYITISIK